MLGSKIELENVVEGKVANAEAIQEAFVMAIFAG